MDKTKNAMEGAGEQGGHIWLRYATQFTAGGRTHTVEMGIPVPIGASAEERERLFREANTGMNQLAVYIEQRVAQIQQRSSQTQTQTQARGTQGAQGGQATMPTPVPPARSSAPAAAPIAPASRPGGTPASMPAPQTSALPSTGPAESGAGREGREGRERRESDNTGPQRRETTQPLIRPQASVGVGASMPQSPGAGDGNLSLPQFIQHIKENLGLTPKQAMELLKVKTLTGVNLRDALDQLQRLVEQEDSSDPAPPSAAITPPAASTPVPRPIPPQITAPASSAKITSIEQRREPGGAVREERPHLAFDEELDLDEGDTLDDEDVENIGDDELEDLEDLEELEQPRELTPMERVKGKTLLNKFRESRGATVATPGRLQVLTNVTDSQISAEQLQSLASGIWGVSTPKKLKVDQVEALISWAKEDDFVNDVPVVLAVLGEEQYARGNR